MAEGNDVRYGGLDVLAKLREQAEQLASALHGAVRRIEVRLGDMAIEVEWQLPAAGTAERAALAPAKANGVEPTPSTVGSMAALGAVVVTAPMIGTFYRAEQPGARPFVEVGDGVEVGQTVGILEAMKLMNPIAAEVAGIVVEIIVADAQPVEFAQPLIVLHPPLLTGAP